MSIVFNPPQSLIALRTIVFYSQGSMSSIANTLARYISSSKMMPKNKLFFSIACFALFFFVLVNHSAYKVDQRDIPVPEQPTPRPKFFQTWSSCVQSEVFNVTSSAEFWQKFSVVSQKCDRVARIQEEMKIVKLRNQDESKFAIFPREKDDGTTFVTLGVGRDITAEQAFKTEMEKLGHNVTFYGADPIFKENADLFSQIGTYFPFAVSGSAGFSMASVYLNGLYQNVPVATIDIYYFLNTVLKKKFVDHLWMDAEYAEFELFDMFYKDGPLDELNIEFCQMSIEVHHVSDEKRQNQFREFIKRLIEEQRFGFFLAEYVGHNRFWLFNFGSEACVQKYL